MVSFTSALLAAAAGISSAAALSISVSSTGGNATSPMQYGIMHEDINNGGDGGAYAELIQNRALQASEAYPVNLDWWQSFGGAVLSIQQLSTPLSSALPNSINVAVPSGASGQVGLANEGFWGMDVQVQQYTGSFWVKGSYKGSFTAWLRSNLTSDVWGSVQIASAARADAWVQHNVTITPTKAAPNSNNTFAITFDAAGASDGSLDFNLVSLFPPTYKNRPNGNRIDIMEALAELKPKFFRLPGGNMLEGNTNTTFWLWNNTIGPLKDRPGFPGVWGYEVTQGQGIVEYLNWAQDLGAKPILAVWDGLALNGDVTPKDKLDPYVQSALDEIEFLRGDVTTKWGAVRASLGFPDGWDISIVEVGNEDWLAGAPEGWQTYKDYRLPMFLDAINAKYPDIQVLASGSVFDNITIPAPAGGDRHDYQTPDGFQEAFNFFDQLGPKNLTLIGESATVHPNGGVAWSGPLQPYPWWGGAVAEAIYLIGAERNSPRVIGATYAPMLRNMNRWQWAVTLLQHAADPKLTTRSTSFYVWKLLSNHIITHNLPTTADGPFDPVYWVAGKDETSGGHIFKAAVYNTTATIPMSVTFEGAAAPGTKGQLTILTGPANPYGYNDPFLQNNVVKTNQSIVTADATGAFTFVVGAQSVVVLDTNPALVRPGCNATAAKARRAALAAEAHVG